MSASTASRRARSPLALLGGAPTVATEWPAWPRIGEAGMERVRAVLEGRRWAVSGTWEGEEPLDAELARRFARFVGVDHCVPLDHGSSALVAALVALGVGPGDEVVVPGLTWVACASAPLRLGAVPVLADVDPETLCVDPEAVRAALTPRTAAILAVHLYAAMAEMDALRAIADAAGVALIEDAAQAHGARWRGGRAGSFGDVGVFSMQQGKILTAGEGGAAVTSDADLAATIERLRGDGRAYRPGEPRPGRPDLDEGAGVQGWNMHLSELQAALLLDGLERLEEEVAARARAAARLDRELSAIPGLSPGGAYPANDGRSYYHYVVKLDREAFAGRAVETICEALAAELGCWVHPTYPPLDVHPLYRPLVSPPARDRALRQRLDPARFELPAAHREAARTVLLHHPLLLSEDAQLDLVPLAFERVRRHADLLPAP